MQNSASEIAKICESWWGHLTDSSKVEQRAYVMKLLALLDWDLPIPFSPQATAEQLNALTYLLRGGGQTTIATYFLMPGALDAPSAVIEKGLDFCPVTRALLEESQSPNIHYALISDLYRSYFYDAQTDELLLHADDPAVWNKHPGAALAGGLLQHSFHLWIGHGRDRDEHVIGLFDDRFAPFSGDLGVGHLDDQIRLPLHETTQVF